MKIKGAVKNTVDDTPIDQATVVLDVDGREIATLYTGRDGTFVASDASEDDIGKTLTCRVEADGFHAAAPSRRIDSNEVAFDIELDPDLPPPPPKPVHTPWYHTLRGRAVIVVMCLAAAIMIARAFGPEQSEPAGANESNSLKTRPDTEEIQSDTRLADLLECQPPLRPSKKCPYVTIAGSYNVERHAENRVARLEEIDIGALKLNSADYQGVNAAHFLSIGAFSTCRDALRAACKLCEIREDVRIRNPFGKHMYGSRGCGRIPCEDKEMYQKKCSRVWKDAGTDER